jgi:hypothetical protein
LAPAAHAKIDIENAVRIFLVFATGMLV